MVVVVRAIFAAKLRSPIKAGTKNREKVRASLAAVAQLLSNGTGGKGYKAEKLKKKS